MINFTRSPHPPCCFLLQHTLVSPPQSSSPLPQTLSQQLHPPQRHQRLQTTPQYYWTSQLPLPHFLGHQIPLHLLWHEEIPLYHHTSLPRQTPSPSTQHICFHNPIPYILLLDNSYFEFNGQFYSQDTGVTMGSPLVVELAEIRVADVENTALTTYKTLPTPTDTLSTTELETFVINHTRMDSSATLTP